MIRSWSVLLRQADIGPKKATVTEALEEYIQRRKQAKVVRLFGKIDLDKDYNYKEQRRRV